MKRTGTIFFTALMLSAPLIAQQQLFLEEQEISTEEGNINAWVMPVTGDLENALDHLEDYCKDRSGIRMKSEGDYLLMAEEVSIPTITTSRGDLIGYGFSRESYNAIGIAFKLGYDISLNSEKWHLEMNNLRNYAREFMSYHYGQFYLESIEQAENEIQSLERDLRRKERELNRLERKIENTNDKLSVETDPDRIEGLNEEAATLNAEKEEVNNILPQLRSRIDLLKEDIERYKNESMMFQNAISSL